MHRDDAHDEVAEVAAAKIIKSIREQGDVALLTLTAKLDKHKIARAAKLEIPISCATAALKSLQKNEPKVAAALRESARRIKRFHRAELQKSWHITERDGSRIGQRVTPLSRVGVYVPGGTAAYPSSVLMTVIPAAVAGVDEIVMATPTPGGEINRAVLAAAALAGVHRIFAIGGAQAIAALAYGTATVPAVDKIVGPGNRFVAAAKRQVFGKVGIDSIAGPSEVVVVCDAAANSEWVAMDLCAQAEHDARAQAIAITDDATQANAIVDALTRIVPQLPRRKIIAKSLADYGAIITVADLAEAIKIVNQIAPEHLELMVAKPQRFLRANSQRRRDFYRRTKRRIPRRLLRRTEPCFTHCRHRPIRFAARREAISKNAVASLI